MNYSTLTELRLSDSSLNGRFHTCERKFEINKMIGHPRAEWADSIPTGAGHALHAAYQGYLTDGNKERALWNLLSRYPMHLQETPFNPRSVEACVSTFEEMINSQLNARYELAWVEVKGEKRPAVEVPFRITFKDVSAVPDRHVPIYYDGFIDVILWDSLEQKYVVMDIKTTRKPRSDYTEMFKRDAQCLPYAFVLEKALGQEASSLSVLYFVAFIDAMTPRAITYEFPKTKYEIEAWAMATALDINQIRLFASMGFFPARGKSCDGYSICEYAEVCGYEQEEDTRRWLELKYGTEIIENANDPTQNFKPWFELDLSIEGLA